MEKTDNHILKYDFLRIIFMLMTLGVHVVAFTINVTKIDASYYSRIILDSLFLICNPLFFMLSGRLNLNKKFEKREDYTNYYKKKFISIFVPFFIISIIIYIFNFYNDINISLFLRKIITNKIELNGTLWFVYTLIGILLLSPFYSKMLHNMNRNEKKMFLIISGAINFIITLLAFFNINSALNLGTVGIVGWHFYYFAGYIVEDLFKEKDSRYKLYILGVFAFLLEIVIKMKFEYYYKLSDPCILLTLKAFAFFVLITNIREIKNLKVQKLITFIAKYTYVFYLIHMIIVERVTRYIGIYNNQIYFCLIYLLLFIIIICISIILQNLIIAPIQHLFEKLFQINKVNKLLTT